MAVLYNGRQRLLAVAKILLGESDEQHPISMQSLLERLDRMGITAERKSLYHDIESLREEGLPIENDKQNGYYIKERLFELPELKLLVDAVQASRSISQKKSVQMITKLKTLTSAPQAHRLQRQVFVSGRVKSMNEALFYHIDVLHEAINARKKIEFQYYEYGRDKQLHLRRGGEKYRVSPYLLCWEDENYYLVAYHERYGALSHFRVDKMKGIRLLEEEAARCEIDSAKYAQQTFSMFASDAQSVELTVPENKIGIIIDRFGKDIFVAPAENGNLSVQLKVAVSPAFFSWVFMLGREVRITHPEAVAEAYQQSLRDALSMYE